MTAYKQTTFKAIVDSSLTREYAVRQNPEFQAPESLINELTLFEVNYFGFDGELHLGQIVAHKDLVEDIKGAFKLILDEKFPIQSVIPIAADQYLWNDSISTAENNSSAYNYRYVRNTTDFSNHATGRALDINPFLNPYFPGKKVFPLHSSYDETVPGTIIAGSKLVQYFKNLGWRWGGDWNEDLDYQHFEKLA